MLRGYVYDGCLVAGSLCPGIIHRPCRAIMSAQGGAESAKKTLENVKNIDPLALPREFELQEAPPKDGKSRYTDLADVLELPKPRTFGPVKRI